MLRVIGLMSGTSVDGIDAALVEISGHTIDLRVNLIAGTTYPYPAELREKILAVCGGAALSIADLAELDDTIAQQFAQAARTLQVKYAKADLIGSHGQTVYHRPPERYTDSRQAESEVSPFPGSLPPSALGYSLQLGRGSLIAHLTGTTTVTNFRAADIAAGGQGAPLVPPIDACLLSHPTYNRCVQNIGGMGNVTYLPARAAEQKDEQMVKQIDQALPPARTSKVLGWDTGPGNVLLDLAVQHFAKGDRTYDQDGAWAATGAPCHDLVTQWLNQDFFQQPPPKSTGRELFGTAYLQQCLRDIEPLGLSPADSLATLTELTAAAIAHSYRTFLPQLPDQVLLCGGGSKNRYLRQRLQVCLDSIPILTTDDVGLNADFKEAIAFAVLAYWRHLGIPGNLPEVTGAYQAVTLGEIYYASPNSRVIA